MANNYLTNGKISASQLCTWIKSSKTYIEQYIEGKPFIGNKYTRFGTDMHKDIELDKPWTSDILKLFLFVQNVIGLKVNNMKIYWSEFNTIRKIKEWFNINCEKSPENKKDFYNFYTGFVMCGICKKNMRPLKSLFHWHSK